MILKIKIQIGLLMFFTFAVSIYFLMDKFPHLILQYKYKVREINGTGTTSSNRFNKPNLSKSKFKTCEFISSSELLKYGKINKYKNNIPKIIHYQCQSLYIPNQVDIHVKQCMSINEDALFVMWNDFTSYQLVIKHFPEYLNLYQSYFQKSSMPLKRSDLMRYFILYKFGGIYMDLDTKCQKNFGPVMINSSCILSREVEQQSQILYNIPYIAMNSLMACVPHHLFFKYVLKKLTHTNPVYILSQTGPIMMTMHLDIYQEFITILNTKTSEHLITVSDAYLFSPFAEEYVGQRCSNKQTGYWQKIGCQNWGNYKKVQNNKTKEAVAIHLLLHLAYAESKHKITNVDFICNYPGNIKMIFDN